MLNSWTNKVKSFSRCWSRQKVEKWLLNQGYDTTSVRDIDPRVSGKEILEIAVSEKRMVIAMDKDFGELIYNSGLLHGGVLLLRLEDAKRATPNTALIKWKFLYNVIVQNILKEIVNEGDYRNRKR